MTLTIQARPLSEASKAIDAAYACYLVAVREGVYLWHTHGSQEAKDACRVEKETAYSEWRRLIGEFEGGA